MTTVFDVPAELLINTVADEFRDNNDKIVAPEWTKLVKTGVHKERKPENIDWWYVRCASILRRVYIDGPVGVRSLRTEPSTVVKKTEELTLKNSEKVVALL